MGFRTLCLGIGIGIVVPSLLEGSGLYEKLHDAAELQLRDFVRNPKVVLQIALHVFDGLRDWLKGMRTFVFYESGLLSIGLGFFITCAIANAVRAFQSKSRSDERSKGSMRFLSCCYGGMFRLFRTSGSGGRKDPFQRARAFFQGNAFGLMVALVVFVLAMALPITCRHLETHERIRPLDWISSGVGKLELPLTSALERIAHRPCELRAWMCLPASGSDGTPSEDGAFTKMLRKITMQGGTEEVGACEATAPCWIQEGVRASVDQLASGISESVDSMGKGEFQSTMVGRIASAASDSLMTFASKAAWRARETLWPAPGMDIPLVFAAIYLLCFQAALPGIFVRIRALTQTWDFSYLYSSVPERIRLMVSSDTVLNVLFLLTAFQLFIGWLADTVIGENSRLRLENFALFCRPRQHPINDHAFVRFVCLCICDTFNRLLRLLSVSRHWKSQPAFFSWLAIAPPTYIFWGACVATSSYRLEMSIPIIFECLSRALNRPSYQAASLGDSFKTVKDEVVKHYIYSPLEVSYASVVMAFCTHSFMPDGCLPDTSLWLLLPASLLRGCAAFVDFRTGEQQKVMPKLSHDVPGQIWVGNLWFQGMCFSYFTREELKQIIDVIDVGAHDTVSVVPKSFRGTDLARVRSRPAIPMQDEEDRALNDFLKVLFDKVEGPQKAISELLGVFHLASLSDSLREVAEGESLQHVLENTIERLVKKLLPVEGSEGLLQIIYQPLLAEVIPADTSLQSILRRIAPPLFAISKEWFLVKVKRQKVRGLLQKWVWGLEKTSRQLDGGQKTLQRVGSLEELLPEKYKKYADILTDWVKLQAEQAFIIGLRGVVIAHPRLKIEDKVSKDRLAYTTCNVQLSGDLMGRDVEVRSDFLPLAKQRKSVHPPVYLPATLLTENEDGTVNVEYTQDIKPLLGYPERSELNCVTFLAQESHSYPMHACISNFGIDVNFEDSESFKVDIDWVQQHSTDCVQPDSEPTLRCSLSIQKITIILTDFHIRAGAKLVGTMLQEAVHIEGLSLKDGTMDLSLEVKLKDDALCLNFVDLFIDLGELDFGTITGESWRNLFNFLDLGVNVFARQIKDMIPGLIKQALEENLKEKPVLPWTQLHELLQEARDAAQRPRSSSGSSERTPVKIRGKVFSGWAACEKKASTKKHLFDFEMFRGIQDTMMTVWLEIFDESEEAWGQTLSLRWYDKNGPYSENGDPREELEEHKSIPLDRYRLDHKLACLIVTTDVGQLEFHVGSRFHELEKIIRTRKPEPCDC